MSDRRIAVVRPLSRSHRPAGIPVTLLTDAPRYQAVPPVTGGKGLRPGGRGSADPALVGVGLAFLRRLDPFVVGGVERVHSRWVRRADRREGRGVTPGHLKGAVGDMPGRALVVGRRGSGPGRSPGREKGRGGVTCGRDRTAAPGRSPPAGRTRDRLRGRGSRPSIAGHTRSTGEGPGRERVCDRGHTAWSTSEQSNSSQVHGPP